MAKIVATIKFKKWAWMLKPLWAIQIAMGCDEIWIPKCAFKVEVK